MPDWREEIRQRLGALDLDPSREAEIIEELSGHAADRYQEHLRRGLTEEDAYQRTLAELSDVQLPASLLQVAMIPKGRFSRRFPFPARILAKYWKLSAVAVLSLAIAIAASVAGLSVFNALLLRLPAAASPSALVTLYESSPADPMQQVSFAEYKFYRDNNQVFSGLAAFDYGISVLSLNYGNRSETAVASTVSESYFQVLGVRPFAGRFLSGDDSVPKAEVVLSYTFWQRLGEDPQMVGKTLQISGREVLVAGIAPKNFLGTVAGFSIDLWAPIRIDQAIGTNRMQGLEDRNSRWLTPIGRLKPGFNRFQAQADVGRLAARMAQDFPKTNKDYSAAVVPASMLPAGQRGLAKMFSWAVMGIVLLVLLAACTNVVNLLLGLATARRQEMLIRAALGATRGKLVRQLLQESILLSSVSGLFGFLLAYAGLQRLFAFRPVILNGLPPLLLDFRPDLRVAALTIAVILAVTLAVGLVPALYASIPNLAGALNGEIAVGGTRKRSARNILVAIQTAVCTLVLVGAGLCWRSLEQLKRVPLGFSARNLVFATLAESKEYTPEQRETLYADTRQEVAALPGVSAVTFATSLPLSQNGPPDRAAPEGQENAKDNWSTVAYSLVEGDYFSILDLPLLAGRAFDSRDSEHSPEVIAINRTLARKYWPDHNPLGKRLRIQNGNRLVQVIAVIGDSKYDDLDEPLTPYMYFALSQHKRDVSGLTLVARTGGDPRLWMEPVRGIIHKLDPSIVCLMETMEGQINLSLLLPRIIFGCVSGFGLLALMLSMAGIYATTSYSVSERKKEIGIRIALGAQPRQVLAALLRQAVLVTSIGLGVGLGLGVAMSALLRSLLYGIHLVELTVLLGVIVLTASIALVTAYLAARPWTRIDPLEAVRHV
ncbi:MAG TPA: ABC transporter permease [Candidatus Angelobacter sp.]